jgi:hypothetical protein
VYLHWTNFIYILNVCSTGALGREEGVKNGQHHSAAALADPESGSILWVRMEKIMRAHKIDPDSDVDHSLYRVYQLV